MNQEVIPFLSSIATYGYLPIDLARGDAGRLYYESYRPANAKGAVVISHGFCESIEKYKEVIYYFTKTGFRVYFADHRGHGRSLRDTAQMMVRVQCGLYPESYLQYIKFYRIVFMDF